MKETILFSNVIGDISALDEDCSFNPNLVCILRSANCENKNLVFINAPGFNNDHLYFDKIIKCFTKIGINFKTSIEISDMSKIEDLKSFPKDRVYFLMGGNPLTQFELIKNYKWVLAFISYIDRINDKEKDVEAFTNLTTEEALESEVVSVSVVGNMDNSEHGEDCDCPECEGHKMVDLSGKEDEEEDNSAQGIFSKLFGENTSETANALKEAIDEVVGTDYAGPLDFNPDTRINASDVLNTLKKEIGQGSEGIHIDRENASNGKYEYKISQVDEKLLPKKIVVGRQELVLKDGSYIPSEIVGEQAK